MPDSERTDIRHVSMRRLRRSVQWVGNVRLHMTGEVSESLLANCEHNGAHHYACASTGLMFDKRTGECVQASTVSLDVTSVVARECSEAQFRSWLSSKMVGDWIKMSKKGAVRRLPALFDDEDVEDSDYEDVRLELI